jgi:SOS-response transcriptional repressor LexA
MTAATAFMGRYPITTHPTCAEPRFALTLREREALDFIKAYQAEHEGLSPRLSDIQSALGYANSRAPVHRLLVALQDKGAIKRKAGSPRGIAVVEPVVDLSSISDAAIAMEHARRFGSASAGAR